MSQEDITILQELFRDHLNRDPRLEETWEDAASVLAPGFEYREDPKWPGADTYHGIEAFRKAVTAYTDAFGEMRVQVQDLSEIDGRVFAFYRWSARGQGGVEVHMDQAGIFTLAGGKVVSWQVFIDRAEALEAVGLSE
jgi:hypothetical protein